MIFKKIVKGTDLDFDISLEKTEYKPGETVRGLLTLNTKKGSRARQLMLFAEGKESTIITVEESTRGYNSSSSKWDTSTYSEVNTFFSEDLSQLLQRSVSSNILRDGTLEIPPQNKEIAVEFTLPSGSKLFSSYKGKNANITYILKATADIATRLDVNKEEHFSVINPDKNKVVMIHSGNNTSSFEEDDKINTSTTTTIQKENESFSSTSAAEEECQKTDYSTKNNRRFPAFHGMSINFDLGTMLTKGREKFLKENSEARIDLLNYGNNNNNNNTIFSPGQTLRGNVITLPFQNSEKQNKKNIRGMKITLSGIEHAFAQGFQRVNTIQKYEKNIELNGIGENDNNNIIIPFEFQIPNGINQSYIGKYSEYFWGLEAKVNVAWSSDINARTIIEIV
jgi:hypothetical protein